MPDLPKLPAERWLDEAEAGALVLTATGRLQRHLHEAYAAEQSRQGRVAWTTPAILTWSAWLERQHQERILAGGAGSLLLRPSQTAALWEKLIGATAGTRDLLYPAGLAAQADEAWTLLHAWEMNLPAIEAQAATPEEQRFAAWAKAYAALTDRSGWTDRARLPKQVAAWVADGGGTAWPARVLLAGFDGFEPAQERVIAALLGAGCACIELEPPVRGATDKRASESGALQRIACADPDAEVEAAASWARAQLDAGVANIGIVVQGLAARAPQVERTFRARLAPTSALPASSASGGALPFHVSAAPALAHSPLVRAALRMLRLDGRAVHAGIDLAELEAVLLSPYLGGAVTERAPRGLLARRLRREGEAAVKLGAAIPLAAACPGLKRRLEETVAHLQAQPTRQSYAAWAHTFTGQLRALGWPGHPTSPGDPSGRSLSSPEYQTYERWRDVLDELCGLDLISGGNPTAAVPVIERGEALARLEALAASASFQPQADPAPVQILGHLEAAGLAFDRLWVMGLDDETWPRPTQPHPFLPLGFQRARGLPRASAERELAFAERITSRLKQAGDQVIFSHAVTQGAAKLRPSPLLADLPEIAVEALTGSAVAPPSLAEAIRRSAQLEPRVDVPLLPLAAGAAIGSGTRLFEDMAACPFRAQAAHRLGAEEMPLPQPGLNPTDHGSLLHRALQVFWITVKSQDGLAKLDPTTLEAHVRASVKRALDGFSGGFSGRLSPGLRDLERERLERLILGLLERERLTRGPFTVEASEEPLTATVGGIALRMRVDRVDTLADGSRLLLDYKTGPVNKSGWLGERPDAPQLPLYAVTHPQPPSALAFVQVRTGDIKLAGVAAGDAGILGVEPCAEWSAAHAANAGATWGDLMATWRGVLDELGEQFRAGAAAVDPKARGTCAYCPLPGLCRIDELGELARGEVSRSDGATGLPANLSAEDAAPGGAEVRDES